MKILHRTEGEKQNREQFLPEMFMYISLHSHTFNDTVSRATRYDNINGGFSRTWSLSLWSIKTNRNISWNKRIFFMYTQLVNIEIPLVKEIPVLLRNNIIINLFFSNWSHIIFFFINSNYCKTWKITCYCMLFYMTT